MPRLHGLVMARVILFQRVFLISFISASGKLLTAGGCIRCCPFKVNQRIVRFCVQIYFWKARCNNVIIFACIFKQIILNKTFIRDVINPLIFRAEN